MVSMNCFAYMSSAHVANNEAKYINDDKKFVSRVTKRNGQLRCCNYCELIWAALNPARLNQYGQYSKHRRPRTIIPWPAPDR